MNALNMVKIENTFRINASCADFAASIACTEFSHRDTATVEKVNGEDSTYLIVSTIGETVYYDVVYVDFVSNGKYRVETGSIRLTLPEYLYVTGGDKSVNECGFYIDDGEAISTVEYENKLAYWVERDKSKEDDLEMAKYFKAKCKKVVMVNGEFMEE